MKLNTFSKDDYSGGLNNTASLREIAPNEATVLQNWDITYQGQLRRRNGLTLAGAHIDNNPITGLAAYNRNAGSDLLATGATNLYYLNGASFSKLASALTADPMIDFANVQSLGQIFMSSENNALQEWDRVSTTLNSALVTPVNGANPVPHGNKLTWWENFMLTFNNVNLSATKYPHRVYFSALGDPSTWTTATDFFDVPGDGRLITVVDAGNASAGPRLIFFKERSIQILTGYGTASFKISATASDNASVDEEIGCIAPRGAVRVDNDVWFVDNQAQIRSLQQTIYGTFQQSIMSTKIRGTLAALNPGQLGLTVAWYNANKVYFCFPNGTDTHNSIVCVFDLIASRRLQAQGGNPEAWTVYTGWTPSVMCGSISNGVPDLYIGDGTTGNVYRHAGLDDNGVAINAVFEDGNFDFGSPEQYKNYKFGYITGQAGANNVNVNIDTSIDSAPYASIDTLNLIATGSTFKPTGNAQFGPTGLAKFGGDLQATERFVYSAGGQLPLGKRIRHRLRHNVLGQQPIINSYSSHYRARQLR